VSAFQKFPSIEGFNSAVYHARRNKDIGETNLVEFGYKIKLHGTNAGVRISSDGIHPQSRTRDLALGKSDNYEFAAFVRETSDFWQSIKRHHHEELVIYGEWAGPGVQKSDAVSEIPERTLFVFAIRILSEKNDVYVTEADEIIEILGCDIPNRVQTLGFEASFVIDFGDDESVNEFARQASQMAEDIGVCDPLIKEWYGIEGQGEGMVFMPREITHADKFSKLTFKAKCESHRVKKAKSAVSTKAEIPADVAEFIDAFVTPARLNQGMTEGCGGQFNKKLTGDFLKWMGNDIRKESIVELEKMGCTWKTVAARVSKKCAYWYVQKCDMPESIAA